MEFLLLLLLPVALSGLFGSGGAEEDDPTPEPEGEIWRGGAGNDLHEGTDGADLILGGPGDDGLQGRPGVDLLVGQTGDDLLYGAAGDDLVLGGWGQDTLLGGGDQDILVGGAMDDSLSGGEGHDVLAGSSGADLLQGDAGNDYLVGLDARADLPMTSVLAGLAPTSAADLGAQMRNFVGDAVTDADVTLAAQNLLNADPADRAADTLSGGEGNDILEGDHGDVLTGGAGIDGFRVYTETGDAPVTLTDFDPTSETLAIWSADPAAGSALNDTPAGIEVVVAGRVVAIVQGQSLAGMTHQDWITFFNDVDLNAA